MVAVAITVGYFYIAENFTRHMAAVWAVDGGMFLLLTYLSGIRRAWQPSDLTLKVGVLRRILQEHAAMPVPRLRLQPMLEIVRGSKGRQLPRDARLMGSVDGAPEELIGLQVQCSINTVNNTSYPYLYAVIIARKGFGLRERLAGAEVGSREVLSFEEKDPEVDVAVLRQRTTRRTGYHTRPADQRRIFYRAAALTLRLASLRQAASAGSGA